MISKEGGDARYKGTPWRTASPGTKGDLWTKGDLKRYLVTHYLSNGTK